MLEWGAKTIPEGGWWSIPERLSGDGLLIAGDAAGLVDVPSLKGVHYAMWSGIYAARAIFQALKADDTSATSLSAYDRTLRDSQIAKDLYRRRNMRLAFKGGFKTGALKSVLAVATGGRIPGFRIAAEEDAAEPREIVPDDEFIPDGELTFSKVDAVFRSGNTTRDDIPSHLIPPETATVGAGPVLRTHVSGGRLRVGGGRSRGERAELRRLSSDRCSGAALDASRGRKRTELQAECREPELYGETGNGAASRDRAVSLC